MDETSKRNTRVSPAPNPRRIPTAESVSLIHARKSPSPPHISLPLPSPEDESTASSMQVDAASDVPKRPPYIQHPSSGESSNPEKWFEKSNNNVKTTAPSFMADGTFPFCFFVDNFIKTT
jgi:hypothetical protein